MDSSLICCHSQAEETERKGEDEKEEEGREGGGECE